MGDYHAFETPHPNDSTKNAPDLHLGGTSGSLRILVSEPPLAPISSAESTVQPNGDFLEQEDPKSPSDQAVPKRMAASIQRRQTDETVPCSLSKQRNVVNDKTRARDSAILPSLTKCDSLTRICAADIPDDRP